MHDALSCTTGPSRIAKTRLEAAWRLVVEDRDLSILVRLALMHSSRSQRRTTGVREGNASLIAPDSTSETRDPVESALGRAVDLGCECSVVQQLRI